MSLRSEASSAAISVPTPDGPRSGEPRSEITIHLDDLPIELAPVPAEKKRAWWVYDQERAVETIVKRAAGLDVRRARAIQGCSASGVPSRARAAPAHAGYRRPLRSSTASEGASSKPYIHCFGTTRAGAGLCSFTASF